MAKHKHLIVQDPGEDLNYTRPQQGGGAEFKFPPRDRRVHAQKLIHDIQSVKDTANKIEQKSGHVIHDLCLEIEGQENYKLKIESLQDRIVKPPIEVLSVREVDGKVYATIHVPEKKLKNFVRKIELYETADTKGKKPRPRNQDLIACINSIRFPVLRSFWTDDEELFPQSQDEEIWWEVWIRIGQNESPDEAFSAFVTNLAESDLRFGSNTVHFPERLVFLVYGSVLE